MNDKKQRDKAALILHREREDALIAIDFPDSKTGEMNKLKRAAKATAALLDVYDNLQDPPELANLLRDNFNEIVARLNEICSPVPAE